MGFGVGREGEFSEVVMVGLHSFISILHFRVRRD